MSQPLESVGVAPFSALAPFTEIRRALVIDSDSQHGQIAAQMLAANYNCPVDVTSPTTETIQLDADTDIVLASVSGDVPAILQHLRHIHSAAPLLPIVVAGAVDQALVAAHAMNDGARYFLAEPYTESNLLDAVRSVLASSTPTLNTGHLPHSRHGRIITLFSPKGGSGTTTLAANMAATFAKGGLKTILLDCNFDFGNAGICFGVTPTTTISDCIPDLLNSGERHVSATLLTQSVVHHECGVDLLLAPLRPEEGEHITRQHIVTILDFLETQYDRIVIDTWPTYDDRVIELLDRADIVTVPIAPELPAMHNLGALCRVLDALHLSRDKFHWTLVRSNTASKTDVEDMERLFSISVRHGVVSDGKLVVQSIRDGVPFVLSHPSSRIAQDVSGLCDSLNLNLGESEVSPPGAERRSTASGSSRATIRGSVQRWLRP